MQLKKKVLSFSTQKCVYCQQTKKAKCCKKNHKTLQNEAFYFPPPTDEVKLLF